MLCSDAQLVSANTAANILPAGIYSNYHVVYPGNLVNNNSWLPTDSRLTPLPDQAFQVLPVRPPLQEPGLSPGHTGRPSGAYHFKAEEALHVPDLQA